MGEKRYDGHIGADSSRRITSSQPPRASRSSTDNAEKYAKGDVSLGQDEPSKNDGTNDDAWKSQDDRYSPKY